MNFSQKVSAADLGGEVQSLLAPEDGEGQAKIEGGVHDVHVLVHADQVLLPVVLEADEDHIGAELAETGKSHAGLGAAGEVGGLGAGVVALDVVVLQPALHALLQVVQVHLEYQNIQREGKLFSDLLGPFR